MKAAASLIQIIALSTCFAVHVASAGEFEMAGVRRAIQTISASSSQTMIFVETDAAAEGDALAL